MDRDFWWSIGILLFVQIAYLTFGSSGRMRQLTFIWMACEFVAAALRGIGFPLGPVVLVMLSTGFLCTGIRLGVFPVLWELLVELVFDLIPQGIRALHPRHFRLGIARLLWWSVGIAAGGLALRIAGISPDTSQTIVCAAFVYLAVMFAVSPFFRRKAELAPVADGEPE